MKEDQEELYIESFEEKTKKTNKKPGKNKGGYFSKIIDWVVAAPVYLVVILLPIFFINNVPSPLELNKQALLVGLIGVSTLIWVGKMAWKNEIKFKKSFLLIPILTFLLVYGLSAIFSDYYEQSMWGYFGGENKAFVSVLFFVAFFILVYNNVKNYKGVTKLLLAFLFSGAILTLFGVLQFFEVYSLPYEFAKAKFFNPIGSAYVYSIYIAVVFLVSVTLFLSKTSKALKALLLALATLAFFLLMAINFKIVWIVVLVMLAFILGMTILIENKNPSQSRTVPMIFLVLTLLFILRSKPLLDNSELPVEIFIKYKTAAVISLNSIKDSPLLGSGPTTFANVYKQNRPSNLGDFSVINFNESTSFFFTVASTTGVLGIIAFLFLVISGLVVLLKEMMIVIKRVDEINNLHSYLALSVGVTWLFLTIFLFVYFVNMSLLLLWWLFFALMAAVSSLNQPNNSETNSIKTSSSNSPKASFFLSFGFVLVIIAFIAVLYLQSQKYVSAIYFKEALTFSNQDSDINKVAEKISNAISLDPNRDSYYRDLAVVHLTLAKEKIIEKGLQDLTPEESNFVSTRFRSALQSLNQAKTLNPNNSLNPFSVANLYEEFIVLGKESGEKAIENYREALELDPKNPEIYVSIARVGILLADIETAEANSSKNKREKIETPPKALEHLSMSEEYLKKSLVIKPDHVGSNVLLVTVYEKAGETDKAVNKSKENIEIYPNSAELLVDLGRIYHQQENYSEAEVYFRKALVVNSQYANARYLLGLALDKQGEKDESLAEFEKIKENNPENDLLNKVIDNLKNNRDALFGVGENQTQESTPEIKSETEETEEVEKIEESEIEEG